MSLRIIYGRAGSGKSRFCLNEIKNCLKEQSDKKLFLIVPEQYSLQAEKDLVNILNNHGIMQSEVLTFKRMAWKVFNEVGGAAALNIDSIGKNMIIYRLLKKHRDSLLVYGSSAGRQGFVSSVGELIAELGRYRVEPEQLRQAGAGLSDGDLLKLKLKDLELIYGEYERIIQEKYSEDDLNLLAKRIPESQFLKDSVIWIDEFHGFIPQEYEIIGQLLKVAERVSVTLCSDRLLEEESQIDNSNVFAPSHKTGLRLARVANNAGVRIEKAVDMSSFGNVPPRFSTSPELSHIEKHLFYYPIIKYEHKTCNVSLLVSSNLFTEVEHTAIEILKLVRDEGYRFRDIAVVTRNLDEYSRLVQAVFPQYGVPFFIDKKKDISNHPLIMLIKSVLEIFNRNFSYDSIFSYVKTGLCNITAQEANILENYVLAWGIRGSKWHRGEAWDFVSKTAGEDKKVLVEEEIKVECIRKALIAPLMTLKAALKGRKTAREFCEALFDFLCMIKVPEKINELAENFKQNNLLVLAQEYEQIWNLVMGVLDQIVEVSGDEKLNTEEFSDMLEVGLSECSTGIIPPSVDDVLVGSVERSKSHEIKALFILGANDGVFPMVTNKEGLLSDVDRRKLTDSGMELAADTRSKAFEEQFLVYTAITTPREKLRISYPIADAEGKGLRPSVIVSRFKRIFPQLTVLSNVLPATNDEEELKLLAAPQPAYNLMIPRLSRFMNGEEITPLWKNVYQWFSNDEMYNMKRIETISALSYTNNPGMLSNGTTRQIFGTPLYSSVSRLEKYAACPFAHYVQFGLRVSERKVFKVSAPDIGSFMHEVLDKVSVNAEAEGLSLRDCTREDIDRMVESSMNELLKSKSYQVLVSTKRSYFLTVRLKRIMKRAVWLITEHLQNSGFQPVGYEIQFGGQGDLSYIEIQLAYGMKMRLTGRIDRLDAMKTENGTYLRIIDYKSGNKELKLQDAYYGIQLQLLTYLNAVEKQDNLNFTKPFLPGGVLYFRLDDPIITSRRGIDDEDVEEALRTKLKMKGLLLADPKIIKEMDTKIDGDSKYIPARINKDGNLGRSSAANLEQFGVLETYIDNLLVKLGSELTSGDVRMLPYKRKKQTACDYCAYGSVCAFDPTLPDNNYKNLRSMKNDEAIGCMREHLSQQEGSDD